MRLAARARALERRERSAGLAADVEAAAGAAQVPLAAPAQVALELVDGVEPPALELALGEAERQASVWENGTVASPV